MFCVFLRIKVPHSLIKMQLFLLRIAQNAFFYYFTIAQAASFLGKYTIDQPPFQGNIPLNRKYIIHIFQIW